MVLITILSLLLGSCGIEDYPYLRPVDAASITRYLNERATIDLPQVGSQQFIHFTIYYRIYISGEYISGEISTSDLSRINSFLVSDYAAFVPYTDSDTVISTSIATLFAGRKYYTLYVENANIDSILSNSAMGEQMSIDFAQTLGKPILKIHNTEYALWRTTGKDRAGEIFTPTPDRYFINSEKLNSSENTIATINNDVANNTISGPRYTYVSMYIVVTGQDSNSFIPFYSKPAHIGIFRLPS
jgi:hypothetical protein